MKYMLERRVAMTLLAHPDDAEILCGGTLVRLAEAGWEVHIATVANGDCGSTTLSRDEIAAVRRCEAIAAATKIDATYHTLDEPDVQVVFDKTTNRKAIDLLRRIAPSLLFTHPRHDYMLDHEQVHLLARSAAFSYSIPNASPNPLVPGSAIPWLYYCDPIEGRDPYTDDVPAPTTWVDVSNRIERKSDILACHASQRDWLRSHHGIDEYIDAMKRHNARRGQEVGVAFAEAFVQHRGHPFPQTDLLTQVMGEH